MPIGRFHHTDRDSWSLYIIHELKTRLPIFPETLHEMRGAERPDEVKRAILYYGSLLYKELFTHTASLSCSSTSVPKLLQYADIPQPLVVVVGSFSARL